MSFDFGTDEEKAQLARHKLEMWKQAFRLDKKLLYKFERSGGEGDLTKESAEPDEQSRKPSKVKSGKAAKSKGKDKSPEAPAANGNVKLYLRLAFSGHEKMTEDRLLKQFRSGEPFNELSSKPVKDGEAGFSELEAKFDSLE
jgi:hypothetical protein